MNKTLFLVGFLLGVAYCQDDLDLENIGEKLQDSIPELANFNQSSIPTQEQAEQVLKEKCEKNGGPNAFDELLNSKDVLQECFEAQINTTVVKSELKEAKKTGSMDDVFGKYCKKTPHFMDCTKNFTKKIDSCLENVEKDSLKIMLNITENLANFVCTKNGDRLAMFVAEGGQECLDEKKEALGECINKTMGAQTPKDFSLTSIPLLVFDDQQCENIIAMEACVISELEKCTDKTPANVIEALFKFIHKSLPCKTSVTRNTLRKRQAENPVNVNENINNVVNVIFYQKCKQHANDTKYFDVMNAIEDIQFIIRSHLFSGQQVYCPLFKQQVHDAMTKLANKSSACFPSEESYIPTFILNATDSVLNYLCVNNTSNRLKELLDVKAMQCLSQKSDNPLNQCLENNQTPKLVWKEQTLVTKTQFCGDLKTMHACLINFISLHCPSDKLFVHRVKGVLNAFTAPCKESTSAGNYVVVSSLSLFLVVLHMILHF